MKTHQSLSCRAGAAIVVAVLLSCLAASAGEKILYEGESPFNHIIVTENDRGMRALLFDRSGVRQSVAKVGDPEHLELPYARSMLAALAGAERLERMLVVGLGGGTLPTLLHRHYPEATIDVVEIDPGVVEAAVRFFEFRPDQRLRVRVADGRAFIEQCRQPYDVIFLDAFGANSIPRQLTTQEFLRAVHGAVRPGGIVAANIWGPGSNPLYDSMLRTYQAVFGSVALLRVPASSNEILLAWPAAGGLDRDELARRAAAIARDKSLRYELGELVIAGWQEQPSAHGPGRVLSDADPAERDE